MAIKLAITGDWRFGCQTIEDRWEKIDATRPFGPNPSPSLTPVGWQANWVRREPQATENPVRRFPPGALFWEESLLLSQLSVWGIESLGTYLRRSRGSSTLFTQISILLEPPSQSLTREISRLIVAVAIFTVGIIWHSATARDDELGEVSASAVRLLMGSLLPWEGGGAARRRRLADGFAAG